MKLFVTLSATTLQNSSLSVDFGDGSGTSAALQPGVALATNNTEDANTTVSVSEGDRRFVGVTHDNYGLTCQLHVEISHVYMYEGEFNVSVVVRAGGVEEATTAQNWTMVFVQGHIEDVSVVVDSVVSVQQNVSIEAVVSPVSLFVRYHWSVLDVADRTNTSVILSATTEVPRVQLVLMDAGDYLVNVTASNEVSAVFNSVIITAVVPISALWLSCDDDENFSINAKFDCVAIVEEGTDVGFVWDFDVGNSVHATTGNGSSVATVAFSDVGRYNITVTAWNHLSTRTAWKTVNIADNELKLIAVTTEPAVVGKPVSVTACAAHGGNLTVEFDFGGGSHQLVLNSESRVVTASHVYRHAGLHAVAVKAECSVAVEVIRVTLSVLERMSDVNVQPVSALIAGRRSVFMAVFDGNYVCFFKVCFIGSRPSDHYFRSVCLFVCLSVCLFVQSFSQPSFIQFGSN